MEETIASKEEGPYWLKRGERSVSVLKGRVCEDVSNGGVIFVGNNGVEESRSRRAEQLSV